jgi:perosamine synthetase
MSRPRLREPEFPHPIPSLARRLSRGRLAVLGGTTTWKDCVLALRLLGTNRRLVSGLELREYEMAFARQIGVRHAVSLASGRVGLYGVLLALGVKPGDEVLLQVPTHVVVANAIRYTGARPVYVDCSLDSYNIDLAEAERRITSRTKVLVLQHTFGVPAELDAAAELARGHGIELVEDCVHALGATYAGRQVGSFGRAAFFSTEETKTISSTMGGMVVTEEEELAAALRRFQDQCAWPSQWLTRRYLLKLVLYHVLTEPHLHRYARSLYEMSGRRNPLPSATSRDEMRGRRPAKYEQRLSNAQAAVALGQLLRLNENLTHRRAIANKYAAQFALSGIRTPKPPAQAVPAFVRYPVWVEDREAARRAVSPFAVLGTWFTSVIEEAEDPSFVEYERGSCPRAEAAAAHLVNLPTHQRVAANDVDEIVSALRQVEGCGGESGPG